MASATWNYFNFSNNKYNNGFNWSTSNSIPGNIPGATDASDTAFFGTSNVTSIAENANLITVGQWVFNPGAPTYSFGIGSSAELDFFGAGIIVNGSGVNLSVAGLTQFFNNSSASRATITITPIGGVDFNNASNGGNANIVNNNFLLFTDDSSAGNANIINNASIQLEQSGSAGSATIHTLAAATILFFELSNGGSAQLITDGGGTVDFSKSAGPANDHRLTVGSIAGAGTYDLVH
jgi:hypothetical protein